MLLQIGGQAARHLTEAGLNGEIASNRFVSFVDASPETLVNLSVLGFRFSVLSQSILNDAAEVARERRTALPAITSSELFIGAFRTSEAEAPKAPAFLRDWITKAAPNIDLDAYVTEWMTFYPQGSGFEGLMLSTQPAAAIIERARVIAEEAAQEEWVSARSIVGALIASHRWSASSGVPEFLRGLNINPHVLALAYYEYLSKAPVRERRDDMFLWRTFLGLRDDSYLPRFNAEDVSGDDLLNVKDDVNAFATLIASKRIHPPLSIGLFGDWGSGKSFFMAKMRQKIAEYAARGKDRPDSPFHGRVVQIEFNAWHYVEANLWASLVEHLFRNLKLTYENKDDAETIANRREELLQKLDSLLAQRAAAEKSVQDAELKRDHATQDLDAQKKAADASAALARGLRAQDIWEVVDIGPDARKELQTQLDALGAGQVMQSNEDVRKTVDELRTVGARAKLLTNWIARQPRALVLLLILLVLAPFGAQALIMSLKAIAPEYMRSLSESFVQTATLIATGLGWVASRLAKGRQILDNLDAARGKIDARIEDAEAKRQRLIEGADAKLKSAHAAVEKTKQSVEENEKELAAAKTALLQLNADYRLTRFIDERAASDDYRKLLGVLASVRNDFSMLSDLMNEPDAHGVTTDSRIDRIVLYIDDLDRCPPDKVVDVLQAVHLLLAFKLFVVVVGVDARWISESLEQHHRALRAKTRDGSRVESIENSVIGYEVRPHDYLEKIFQVPFWLERLQWEKTSSYMSNLLADDVLRAGTRPRVPVQPVGGGNGSAGGAQSIETRKVHYTLGEDEAPENDPKQLTIDEKELGYMTSEQLAQLVGRSPRTAKRFVNTYRFFRASIAPQKLDAYLEDRRPPEYRCALMLLAIVVGAPDVSPEIFASIKAAPASQTVKAFAKSLPSDPGLKYADQWKAVRDALSHFEAAAKIENLKGHIARASRFSFRAPHQRPPAIVSPKAAVLPITNDAAAPNIVQR
jgi:hypothetical protein